MTLSAGYTHSLARSADSPHIRTIRSQDVFDALREGWCDFSLNPTHYVFMGLLFPVIGAVMIMAFSGVNMLPLVFPAVTGFALVGPFAALGIYEISKRREAGLDPTWEDAREVLHSPAIGSIFLLGLLLCAIFAVWMLTAFAIYGAVVGPDQPLSVSTFMQTVLTTREGWMLAIVGNLVGFGFAVVVLAISVVSFPLLLDRDVGVATAVQTSVRAVAANPGPMALWGVIVAGVLLLGALPALAGLAVAVPVLGHATWHLYRKVVA